MNKKSKCVLAVGVVIFVLTSITLILCYICDSRDVTDPIDKTIGFAIYTFIGVPVLLEELILFRSVNKFINTDSWTIDKVCYIVSAGLVFCIAVFQIIYFIRAIIPDIIPEGYGNYLVKFLLLTEWPVIVVSFILGSVRTKKRNSSKDSNPQTDKEK